MNRLDYFRFSNMHKRRMYIVLAVFVAVAFVAVSILFVLGVFGKQSDCVRLRISNNTEGTMSGGYGINLRGIPSTNRVADADFEYEDAFSEYAACSADSEYVYFSLDSDLSSSRVRIGSELSVLTIDSAGNMSRTFSAGVSAVEDYRLGSRIAIEDVYGNWIDQQITKVVSMGNVINILTADGRLVTDASSEELTGIFSDESAFVDVCCGFSKMFAATHDGRIYESADGRTFSLLSTVPLTEQSIVAVSAAGDTPVAVLSDGRLAVISSGRATILHNTFDPENTAVLNVGDSLVIMSGEEAYETRNGILYSECDQLTSQLRRTGGVKAASSCGNRIAVLAANGTVISGRFDGEWFFDEISDVSQIGADSICISDTGTVMVVTSTGDVWMRDAEQNGFIDIYSGTGISSIQSLGNNKYVASSGSGMSFYSLVKAIRTDIAIPTGTVFDGDICILKNTFSPVVTQNWEAYGDSTSISSDYSNSSGGYMVITGSGGGLHAASYELDGPSENLFSDGSFYRLETKLRGVGEISNITVWVSGDEGSGFAEAGFCVSGREIRDFVNCSQVFAVTDDMLSSTDRLYLNISFEGTGTLFVDDIYLGEDMGDSDTIPDYFRERITQARPEAIRFESLGISSEGYCPTRLYGISAQSLEQSLRLARDSYSSPWLVFGAFTEQDDIDRFMEYVAGSVSTEYGRLRTDNGTALPWSRQFDSFYIEIRDEAGIFGSDSQRKAFVNYIISMFKQSPYYSDLKDRLFFLDAMVYDAGVVLSSADSHTMGMNVMSGIYSGDKSAIDSALDLAAINAPRRSGTMSSGEYINSVSVDNGGMTAAQLASLMISPEASFMRMCLIDIDLSSRQADMAGENVFGTSGCETALRMIDNLALVRNSGLLHMDILDPMNGENTISADEFSAACSATYYDLGMNTCVVVSNMSNVMQQIVLDGVSISSSDAVLMRYSAAGELLYQKSVSGTQQRFTIQPGEIIIITLAK